MEAPQPDALLEKAEEISGVMFDNLVNGYLNSRITDVVITWYKTDEIDDDGVPIEEPSVYIDGIPAQTYATRSLEHTMTDPTLVQATGQLFVHKVAGLWGSALDYFEELDELDEDLHVLACGEYYKKAKQQFAEQGLVNIGDGEILTTARRLAMNDLGEWVIAVFAQADTAENQEKGSTNE